MPCELCGRDASLQVVPDIYDRVGFKICGPCVREHARVRPVAPGKRTGGRTKVGGEDTKKPRLPQEINCPKCHGDGGDPCPECEGTGGDWEKRSCSLCEGGGTYECYTCKGSGRKLLGACSTCSGSGEVSCEKCGGDGVEERKNVCPHCQGSGHLCPRCGGHGIVRLYS